MNVSELLTVITTFLPMKPNETLRASLEVLYSKLFYAQTGYSIPNKIINVNDFSDQELINAVNHSYKDLVCGYSFSALLHLEMVEKILKHRNRIYEMVPNEKILMANLSFENQSRLLLTTMYNLKLNNYIRIFWILHLFMSVLHNCIRSLKYTNQSQMMCPTIFGSLQNIIMPLTSLVNNFCRKENSFNIKHESSKFKINYEKFYSENLKDHWNEAVRFIVMNKQQITSLIERNKSFGVSTDGNVFFSEENLYLKDVFKRNSFKTKLQDFFAIKMDLTGVFKKMEDNHNSVLREANIDTQINMLRKFQLDFFNFMKIIVLRIIWKHYIYITDLPSAKATSFYLSKLVFLLPYYNFLLYNHLNNFIDFFKLENDEHLKKILNLIGSPKKNTFIRSASKEIIEEIRKASEEILLKFAFNIEAEPLSIEDDESSSQFIKYYRTNLKQDLYWTEDDLCYWMNVSLLRIDTFINYVKYTFRGINFDVINSFINLP